MTTENPICLFCGKPLRKTTQSYEGEFGAPPRTEVNGQKVVSVLRRTKLSYGMDSERVSVWCGKWGGYGDNFFCGLNCGYGWAVMRVEMSEKENPGYVERFRSNMKRHLSDKTKRRIEAGLARFRSSQEGKHGP